ncbi:MAG: serpin family protein [Planctomycetota bacterium]|nr:MAG: serpin family protein [Planctomycetota bacterium]
MKVLCLSLASLLAAPQEDSAATIRSGLHSFSWNLHRQLAAEDGNLVYSPFSLAEALAMTMEGARGETLAQMEQTLGWKRADLASGFLVLHQELKAPFLRRKAGQIPAFQLNFANSLWAQHELRYQPEYEKAMQTSFEAGLFRVDFRKTEPVRERINAWVSDHTRDKIQELIPKGVLDPASFLVLTNALAFKGTWEKPFPERLTQPAAFFLNQRHSVQVPMMEQTEIFSYGETEDLQILDLPYRGDRLVMTLILPKLESDMAAWERSLNAGEIQRWIDSMTERPVRVQLPKFRFSFHSEMSKVLRKLGIRNALELGRANFSGICSDPIAIDAVIHESFIAVDEIGTEASAATAIVMKRSAAPALDSAQDFIANRPFLFLIRQPSSGTVLFLGRVQNPSPGLP